MARSRSKSQANEEWVIEPGTEVYSSDDRKLGGVMDIEDGHLLVHKGGLLSKDYRVPFSAVADHTDVRIDLTVTADQAGEGIWQASAPSAYPPAGETQADDAGSGETERTPVEGFDNVVVPVVEEQLEATRHQVERGAVRVITSVSEHEASLDVPVTEERVRVQRVAVDRPATAADLAVKGRTLDVAVYGEDVELSKQARVVEEVEIAKEGVQEIRHLSGTVHREDVEIVDGTPDHRVDAEDTRRVPGDPER